MAAESLREFAYRNKQRAIVAYADTLIGVGMFDSPSHIMGRTEALVKSRKLDGSRVVRLHASQVNEVALGEAPEMFIPASMIKPVILGAAIKNGGNATWIDDKLAYKLIVDSDNKTFDEVMRKTIGKMLSSNDLQLATDQLLIESGVVISRDSADRRLVNISSLATAYSEALRHLPESVYKALIIPQDHHNTTDLTAKTISKLQARLKSTLPFLFKIGLDKDDQNRIITSYFMQVGEDMCVGYCIGGRFAATQQLLSIAGYLMQKSKIR